MSSRKLDFYLGFLDVVDVRVDEELWLLFISFENCNFNWLLSQKDVIIQKSGFNMQILIAKLFTTPWFPQYQRLNARKASNKSEIEIKLKKYSISQHFKNQNSLNSWFKNPKRHYLECLKTYSNRNATDFLQRKINIYPKICQTAKKKNYSNPNFPQIQFVFVQFVWQTNFRYFLGGKCSFSVCFKSTDIMLKLRCLG